MMALHIEPGDDRGRCVLRLAGDLDAAAAEHLHTTIAHHQGEAAAHHRGEAAEALLILDLGAVGFIDSGGLRSLLQLHITHQRGGGLRLRNLSDPAALLLEVTNLLDVFDIERQGTQPTLP